MKEYLRDFLIMLVIALVVFVGLRITVQTYVIHGLSMKPNFEDLQRLVVNKVVYQLHEPERGDVIIFRSPNNQQETFIKRIIGLPGESVEIKEGAVYIHKEDGSALLLDEPYIKEPSARSFNGGKIPENEYFVLGDNRNSTNDSRYGWTVPRNNIIGKAWLSIWPPSLWGLAANYPLQEQIANATEN